MSETKDPKAQPAWLESFFADRRVAVLAIPRGERPPLTTPVWYEREDGRFVIQVEADSAKARLTTRHGGAVPVSLTIQSEVPPYRYAVVYGRATLRSDPRPGLRQRLARRYFGRLAGDMYVAKEEQEKGVGEDALRLLVVEPERIVSHDFGPEAGASGRAYFALYRWLRPVPA